MEQRQSKAGQGFVLQCAATAPNREEPRRFATARFRAATHRDGIVWIRAAKERLRMAAHWKGAALICDGMASNHEESHRDGIESQRYELIRNGKAELSAV